MSPRSRKWLSTAIPLITTLLVGLFAVWSVQTYRINKINLIIWDNQHGNDAHLTTEELADYFRRCGASVDNSGPVWGVRYEGFLQHRVWIFCYPEPETTSRQ